MSTDQNPESVHQLSITLREISPAIHRRVRVAGTATLAELHAVIQIAMGWTNSHLHMFTTTDGTHYGNPTHDDDGFLELQDELGVTLEELLRAPGQALTYEYDFGDGWEHEVVLDRISPRENAEPLPRCVEAQGRCPPEDVGGPHGFYEFLHAIKDGSHAEHSAMQQWLGEPDFNLQDVDIDAINTLLDDASTLALEREPGAGGGAPDFHGLSPDAVHRLLYATFDAPAVIQWHTDIDPEQAPIMRMLRVLFEQLSEKEIKLTPKGNLPVRTVQAMLDAAERDLVREYSARELANVRSEDDAVPAHIARVLAELEGLTKVQRGRLSLKKTNATDVLRGYWGKVYFRLFRTMMTGFNWAYLDGHGQLDGIQVTGPFTLWLLHQYGTQWQPQTFYTHAVTQAFPALLNEMENSHWFPAEEKLASVIQHRPLRLFRWFGLIERRIDDDRPTMQLTGPQASLRRTPLFEALIAFQ